MSKEIATVPVTKAVINTSRMLHRVLIESVRILLSHEGYRSVYMDT